MGDMADYHFDNQVLPPKETEMNAYDEALHEENLSQFTKKRRNNMSNTTQEVLTVEAVNQYGFKSGGKNYSISTRLAGQGVTPQHFQVGTRIQAEVWTGPQGGKKINSFQPVGGVASTNGTPVTYASPMPPMPPALPVTSVASTPAPGGVAPVQKTSGYVNGNGATADDKMSKQDWAVRNSEIAIQAIVKSSLESPALGEHVTGKSKAEFLELTREFVRHNLETYRMAVQGLL